MHDDPIRTANLLGAAALAISDRMLDTVAENIGCGASAPAALITLLTQRDVGVTELGTHIGLSQPAAARLVGTLVSRGLVERRPGRDGRTASLRLTRRGSHAARRALAARERAVAQLVSDLAPEERGALTRVLEKLLTRLFEDAGNAHLLCRLCDRGTCIAGEATCPVGDAARKQGG